MNKYELYDIVRDAEKESFDTWQKLGSSEEKIDNYHTAFLILHFLSRALFRINRGGRYEQSK